MQLHHTTLHTGLSSDQSITFKYLYSPIAHVRYYLVQI